MEEGVSEKQEDGVGRGSIGGAAFLLAQVGAHATKLFAERMDAIGLTPAHAGIFRILSSSPGLTQKELAAALGALPNRIVGMVDELEAAGLIERRVQEQDRRRHALHITAQGRVKMRALGETAQRHQATLFAALSEKECVALTTMLQRVAEEQGLIPGVHPGYARRWK